MRRRPRSMSAVAQPPDEVGSDLPDRCVDEHGVDSGAGTEAREHGDREGRAVGEGDAPASLRTTPRSPPLFAATETEASKPDAILVLMSCCAISLLTVAHAASGAASSLQICCRRLTVSKAVVRVPRVGSRGAEPRTAASIASIDG